MHALTIRDVQAIKSHLETQITSLESSRIACISAAKTLPKESKEVFYVEANKLSRRIAKLAKIQKTVKKFLTDSHT